jgi:hypothetical protein
VFFINPLPVRAKKFEALAGHKLNVSALRLSIQPSRIQLKRPYPYPSIPPQMSAADYSTLSVAELMERFEVVVADLGAIRKALKKAAKVKRAPKVDEDGEPVKRVASVWAAWSAHAKTTYKSEYDAFVAAEAAKGKKQGLVPVFAKQAKEVHAADYEVFAARYEAEHPKSSASSVASSKKAKAAAAAAAAVLETTDDEAGSTKKRGRKPAAAATGGAGAGAGLSSAAASDAESSVKPKKAAGGRKPAAAAAAAASESEAEPAKPKAKREAKVAKKTE